MPRLTLRTLLAYIDDTLNPTETRSLGRKVAASDEARELVERIKKVTRRRGLKTPVPTDADDETADPNTVAEYLDNTLDSDTLKQLEETCLASDVHLAEVAACHQILTLVLTEPVRVPPRAHRRMYGLQSAPAATPGRRPNKKLPVGGVRTPERDRGEHDDADAALLLGMKRYSATTTWAARFALFGIAAAMLAFLTVGVYMALPHQPPKPPETTPGYSFAQLTPEETLPVKPKTPEGPAKPGDPIPIEPKPKVVDVSEALALAAGGVVGEVAATKSNDPGPGLADPVSTPDTAVREIGRVETSRTLVVTQDPAKPGVWSRLRVKGDGDEIVVSNAPVMALPGYKANVLIGARDKQVQVYLWGNVPEQIPYRVFESRVKFHPPAAGFDADLTLLGGRIYLKSKKPEGDKNPASRKVRVRAANEVWDISLPDEKTDVLVELISWFEPGTTYARAGGAPPKQEGRVAVLNGAAKFAAPRRFKTVDKFAVNTQIVWDSGSGALADPQPITNMQEATANPTLDGDDQKNISRIFTETADRVTERNVVRQVIESRLDPPPTVVDREAVARLTVYSLAALADNSPPGDEMLKTLVDVLKSELPWFVRQSVVTALTAWVARDRGNTAILRAVLVSKGLGEDKDDEDAADRFLRLIRGFVSPTKPDPERLDELGKLLADKSIPVREAALWNIASVDLETWVPPPARANVGAVGAAVNSEDYKKFLANWRGKIEMLKKRTTPFPLPRPVPKDGKEGK